MSPSFQPGAIAETAERLFRWNLQVSIEGAILVLLVLLVQRIFRQHLSPSWRFSLWLLVAVRLLLPAVPQSTASIFNLVAIDLPQPAKTILVAPKIVPLEATLPRATGEPLPGARKTPPIHQILLLIWLSGVSVLLLNLLAQHWNFSRRMSHRRQLTDPKILDLLEDCKVEIGVKVPVVMIAADDISSPALFGWLRPRILVPAKILESLSIADLRFVLLHELAHIKRLDIPMNWIITVLQIFHWFNPVLWWGFAKMRADREVACDDAVLRNTGEKCSREYGHTILKLLESYSRPLTIPGTTGIMEEKLEMRDRIRMIAAFSDRKAIPVLAAVLFIVLAVSGLTAKPNETSVPAKERHLVIESDTDGGEIGEVPAELYFGGAGDVFVLGNELGNFKTNDFTIEFWLNTFPGPDRYIMGKRFLCDNDSFWNLGMKKDGAVCFEMNHDKSGQHYQRVDGTKRVDDRQYHHIAIIRAGRDLSIFVDGSLDGMLKTPFVVDVSNPAHFTLGKSACTLVNGSPFFGGQLKNLSVYNHALPPKHVQTLSVAP